MKHRPILIWCALVASALPRYAFAEDTFGQAVAKLTRVGTGLNSEGIYLDVDLERGLPMTVLEACQSPKSLVMGVANPQYKDVLSIALVAIAQARPVEITYVNNSCSPNGGKIVLRAVALRTGP